MKTLLLVCMLGGITLGIPMLPMDSSMDFSTDDAAKTLASFSAPSAMPQATAPAAEKLFACTECLKAFAEKSTLAKHMRTHVSKKEPFACKKLVKTHTIKKASKEKPYACKHPGCGQTFARPDYLTKHMLRHTGVKPFKCDLCGRGFTRRKSLNIHMNSKKIAKMHTALAQRAAAPTHAPSSVDLTSITMPAAEPVLARVRTIKAKKGPVEYERCMQNIKESVQQSGQEVRNRAPFVCIVCPLPYPPRYTKQSLLEDHMRVHTS